MTLKTTLATVLESGDPFTAEQLARKAKTSPSNISKRISELRADGYAIYRNGNTYRMGKPSRKMVAAAYEAVGAEVFE